MPWRLKRRLPHDFTPWTSRFVLQAQPSALADGRWPSIYDHCLIGDGGIDIDWVVADASTISRGGLLSTAIYTAAMRSRKQRLEDVLPRTLPATLRRRSVRSDTLSRYRLRCYSRAILVSLLRSCVSNMLCIIKTFQEIFDEINACSAVDSFSGSQRLWIVPSRAPIRRPRRLPHCRQAGVMSTPGRP